MTTTLWNLAWALPLVLLAGLVAALALRRILAPAEPDQPAGARARLLESLEVSHDTRLHLIEVDRHSYLLVESVMQTSLHATAVPLPTSAPVPTRIGAAWLVRLCRGPSR